MVFTRHARFIFTHTASSAYNALSLLTFPYVSLVCTADLLALINILITCRESAKSLKA